LQTPPRLPCRPLPWPCPCLQQATETDDLFLAVAATLAAAGSVLVGKRFDLDLSARLFVIAFLLVSFNALEGKGEQRLRCSASCRQRWLAVLAALAALTARGCDGACAALLTPLLPTPPPPPLVADPLKVAITRIGGIAGGVATMLLMSIIILPKSASVESLRT
jgi:hypothetical protein